MNGEPSKDEMIPVPVQPLVTPEQAAEAWRLFLELKEKLLNDDDYQPIAGKKFIKKSGFRKIAVAFNLSDRILESERTDRVDDSFYWRIVVEVEAPNGRRSTGVGICDSRERKFAHVEHDVFSTCHTRAKNRAISDMVAGGVVSAEEVSTRESEPQQSTITRDQQELISDFEETTHSNNIGTVTDVIESVGSDIKEGDLEISTDEDGRTIVRPTKYLDTHIWNSLNSALWQAGFSWTKAGKEGYWSGVSKE